MPRGPGRLPEPWVQPGFGRKGRAGPESRTGGRPPSSPGSGPVSASFSLAACGLHGKLCVAVPQLPSSPHVSSCLSLARGEVT